MRALRKARTFIIVTRQVLIVERLEQKFQPVSHRELLSGFLPHPRISSERRSDLATGCADSRICATRGLTFLNGSRGHLECLFT